MFHSKKFRRKIRPSHRQLLFSIANFILLAAAVAAAEFPAIFNTEPSKETPLSPAEAAEKISVPPGFSVTLFAGEPDVQQPIAITTDDLGRLWVAENYTYAENPVQFEKKLRDRITILEDSNHDGHFDKRKVFWDQGQKVTSVALGFGGVWVLAAPQLLFLPDRNGDDLPDGAPEIVLDGWNDQGVAHNIVNGLRWGPDGWLYGRHGILATSQVGPPGTPEKERTPINCGIWRYHPTRKVFEVVASGTTNPWGLDFDDYGQAFFINTVIGHLFHVIPGAHYRRMYGEDLTPRTYELIDQHADHFHWDTGKKWTESRDAKGLNDTLGGGHAHSGLMVYLGGNWPDKYRNTIFTVNLHGYRLNNDLPERSGSGYTARHGEDFLKTTDKWFRGIDLIYGNDGGVFLADWSDTGECHESDGVHRSSGRIYKIRHGTSRPPEIADVSQLSDSALVKLQLHQNDWYVRQARRVLQERAAAGKNLRATKQELVALFNQQTDIPRKLRAMWALHATGGAGEGWLWKQLQHPNEHIRLWAVRFLTDTTPVHENTLQRLHQLSQNEKSPLVRLFLAAALQRLPVAQRFSIATELAVRREDANDHNLPLMIWYGLEPIVAAYPERAGSFATSSKIPLLQTFVARRLTEDIEKKPGPVEALVLAAASGTEETQLHILQGMAEAMKGWRQALRPASWGALRDAAAQSSHEKLKELVRGLSLQFGDETALAELKSVILNEQAGRTSRRSALQKLIENKPADLPDLLQTLVTNAALAPVAVRGLSMYDDPTTPALIVRLYPGFSAEDRPEIISTLVSRPVYALALLEAVATGKIPRRDISAYHARQICSLNEAALSKKLAEVWGDVRGAGEDKKPTVAKYKALFSPERLQKTDTAKGRELFNLACALCHTLYGEGAKIGPDLTGSGRSHLDYLLENIIDPSAIVGADFKMAVVTLKDGRVLNGMIAAKTERTVTVQSLTESLTLERAEIVEMKDSATSLMPEGLLESLPEEQVADLLAYLMSPQQVALPGEKK